MNIQEMLARQQEIVNAARRDGRDLTDEERNEFDELQRSIEAANADPAPAAGGSEGSDGAEGGEGARSGAQTSGENGAGVLAERQRISDIVALCRETGLDSEQYIRSGASLETVRAAALTHLLRSGSPVRSGVRAERDNFRAAATDALLMRAGVEVREPAEGVETFRGMSLRDLAIECMAREGVGSTASLMRMGRDDLWQTACRQFFNPTSAFPAILDNAIRKSIEHRYTHVPTTYQLWTRRGSLSDFKASRDHSYLVGGAGEFLRVGENGELKHDVPKSELMPERKLDTYGRQFSMTRQAFINDDIGFITEVPAMYAESAKRTINKQVYGILVDNPAIFDGVKLFDKAHNNLIETGTKPTVEAIQSAMLKMLTQTDPFGESIMLQPAYIIVPVGYKFLMTTIFESPTLNTEGNTQAVNPLYQYRTQIQIVEDACLNALSAGKAAPWFIAADSGNSAVQVDYLNGQELPTIRRSEIPGVLGFVWDIWLDWGISVRDFRSIVKNNGVEIKI